MAGEEEAQIQAARQAVAQQQAALQTAAQPSQAALRLASVSPLASMTARAEQSKMVEAAKQQLQQYGKDINQYEQQLQQYRAAQREAQRIASPEFQQGAYNEAIRLIRSGYGVLGLPSSNDAFSGAVRDYFYKIQKDPELYHMFRVGETQFKAEQLAQLPAPPIQPEKSITITPESKVSELISQGLTAKQIEEAARQMSEQKRAFETVAKGGITVSQFQQQFPGQDIFSIAKDISKQQKDFSDYYSGSLSIGQMLDKGYTQQQLWSDAMRLSAGLRAQQAQLPKPTETFITTPGTVGRFAEQWLRGTGTQISENVLAGKGLAGQIYTSEEARKIVSGIGKKAQELYSQKQIPTSSSFITTTAEKAAEIIAKKSGVPETTISKIKMGITPEMAMQARELIPSGLEYVRAPTAKFLTKIGLKPTEGTILGSPEALKTVSEVGQYFIPGVGEGLFFGPTAVAAARGPKEFVSFASREPVEVIQTAAGLGILAALQKGAAPLIETKTARSAIEKEIGTSLKISDKELQKLIINVAERGGLTPEISGIRLKVLRNLKTEEQALKFNKIFNPEIGKTPFTGGFAERAPIVTRAGLEQAKSLSKLENEINLINKNIALTTAKIKGLTGFSDEQINTILSQQFIRQIAPFKEIAKGTEMQQFRSILTAQGRLLPAGETPQIYNAFNQLYNLYEINRLGRQIRTFAPTESGGLAATGFLPSLTGDVFSLSRRVSQFGLGPERKVGDLSEAIKLLYQKGAQGKKIAKQLDVIYGKGQVRIEQPIRLTPGRIGTAPSGEPFFGKREQVIATVTPAETIEIKEVGTRQVPLIVNGQQISLIEKPIIQRVYPQQQYLLPISPGKVTAKELLSTRASIFGKPEDLLVSTAQRGLPIRTGVTADFIVPNKFTIQIDKEGNLITKTIRQEYVQFATGASKEISPVEIKIIGPGGKDLNIKSLPPNIQQKVLSNIENQKQQLIQKSISLEKIKKFPTMQPVSPSLAPQAKVITVKGKKIESMVIRGKSLEEIPKMTGGFGAIGSAYAGRGLLSDLASVSSPTLFNPQVIKPTVESIQQPLIAQVPLQTPIQVPTQVPVQVPIQEPVQLPIQEPLIGQVPIQIPAQVPVQVPAQILKQTPIVRGESATIKTQIAQSIITPPTPPKFPPFEIFPPQKKYKTKVSGKPRRAFQLLVRKAGRYVPIGRPTARGTALRRGTEITLGHAEATFKLKPTKGTAPAAPAFTPSPRIFRTYKVSKGRIVPLADTFIQRRVMRIKSPGEKIEISLKGARVSAAARSARAAGIPVPFSKRVAARKGRSKKVKFI